MQSGAERGTDLTRLCHAGCCEEHRQLVYSRRKSVFGALQLVAAAVGVAEGRAQAASSSTQRESVHYEVITKGLLGSPVFTIPFRTTRLRLEIRNFIVGPGTADDVPVPARAIMELRGGGVVTSVNGEARERRPGDFWVVDKGAHLRLENHADVAVIRVIFLYQSNQ
jgi:hypothetical protein